MSSITEVGLMGEAPMRIFISWSGENSQAAAMVLNDALPVIIQSIKPFISVDDLRKGGRWQAELSEVLQSTSVGIICITKTNIDAPWVLFEAGALSKVVDDSCVMPLLIGLTPSEIRPPLSQFNVTVFEKDDFFRLIKSINERLGELALPPKVLTRCFEQAWPDIERQVVEISAKEDSLSRTVKAQPEDPLKKVGAAVEEILSLVRSQVNAANQRGILKRAVDADFHSFINKPEQLGSAFLVDLERRRRAVLTALYELDKIGGGDGRISKIAANIDIQLKPVFQRFLGDADYSEIWNTFAEQRAGSTTSTG